MRKTLILLPLQGYNVLQKTEGKWEYMWYIYNVIYDKGIALKLAAKETVVSLYDSEVWNIQQRVLKYLSNWTLKWLQHRRDYRQRFDWRSLGFLSVCSSTSYWIWNMHWPWRQLQSWANEKLSVGKKWRQWHFLSQMGKINSTLKETIKTFIQLPHPPLSMHVSLPCSVKYNLSLKGPVILRLWHTRSQNASFSSNRSASSGFYNSCVLILASNFF